MRRRGGDGSCLARSHQGERLDQVATRQRDSRRGRRHHTGDGGARIGRIGPPAARDPHPRADAQSLCEGTREVGRNLVGWRRGEPLCWALSHLISRQQAEPFQQPSQEEQPAIVNLGQIGVWFRQRMPIGCRQ
jgi:hypothetical protein